MKFVAAPARDLHKVLLRQFDRALIRSEPEKRRRVFERSPERNAESGRWEIWASGNCECEREGCHEAPGNKWVRELSMFRQP